MANENGNGEIKTGIERKMIKVVVSNLRGSIQMDCYQSDVHV